MSKSIYDAASILCFLITAVVLVAGIYFGVSEASNFALFLNLFGFIFSLISLTLINDQRLKNIEVHLGIADEAPGIPAKQPAGDNND